jgi:hypothetical protein
VQNANQKSRISQTELRGFSLKNLSILLGSSDGDGEIEGAALAFYAFSPNQTLVSFDQVPGNCQTEPGASAGACPVGFIEALEYPGESIGWNTHPGIFHRENNLIFTLQSPDGDLAAAWCEFDRIVKEVD